MSRLERRGLFQSNFDDFVIDVAGIHARVDDMFDFARRESQTIPSQTELATILRSIKLLQFWEDEFDRIRKMAVRRYTRKMLAVSPYSQATKFALKEWIEIDRENVMRQFQITADREYFVFSGFRYCELRDAVSYAALVKSQGG